MSVTGGLRVTDLQVERQSIISENVHREPPLA